MLLSFKTRIKWPPLLTATACFPAVFFLLLQYSRKHPSFSAHKAALMTKTDFIFSAFLVKICRFRSYFCFRCNFSSLEKPFELSLTVAWFFWTNHDSLLRIATNEIASFYIDTRLRQMDFFFHIRQSGQTPAFELLRKISKYKSWSCMFLNCIKQRDSTLPCVKTAVAAPSRHSLVFERETSYHTR